MDKFTIDGLVERIPYHQPVPVALSPVHVATQVSGDSSVRTGRDPGEGAATRGNSEAISGTRPGPSLGLPRLLSVDAFAKPGVLCKVSDLDFGLLQLRVLGFGFFQDGDVGVGPKQHHESYGNSRSSA
jgi:hypothetical protein